MVHSIYFIHHYIRALDAVNMTWDNVHLKNILMADGYCDVVADTTHHSGSFNNNGQPLWHGKIFHYIFLLLTFCLIDGTLKNFISLF